MPSIIPVIQYQCDDWQKMDAIVDKCFDIVMSTEIHGVRAGEAAIIFTDDHAAQKLNRAYRQKDAPTNVLSFPVEMIPGLPEEAQEGIGDIVFAFETCQREAMEQGKSFEDHMSHLLFHGMLHLFGYDHQTDAEAAEMEALEVTMLAKLNIPNPYEIMSNEESKAHV